MAGQGYRRDIDGLRAVAVLSVVLFHARVPGFSGGFVGVDVFFVISGYLITGILRREIEAGTFSLVAFYDRRIRRILPALFVVLIATFAAALVLLLPPDLKTFGRSALAAGFFASNVFFQRDHGYFAGEASEKPLLHTWSLSVEEQFYIVWPLVLVVVLARKPGLIWPVLIGLFAISFGLAQFSLADHPEMSFYLAPWRAWELIMGAFLVFLPGRTSNFRAFSEASGWIGLGLVCWSVVTFDHNTSFPGLWALLPCLGAALVIHSGVIGGTSAARLLSWQPIVFIGLISYGFYLWHWPLLVFARHAIGREPNISEALAAVSIAAVLASVSLRLIERPFRVRAPVPGRTPPSIFAAAAGLLVVVAAGGFLVETNGLRSRFEPHVLAALDAHERHDMRRKCLRRDIELPPIEDCLAGARASSDAYDIAVWGDSHANHFFPMVARQAEARGARVRLLSRSACPPLPGATRISDGREQQACNRFNQAALDEILGRPEVKLVILSGRWAWHAETTEHDNPKRGTTFLIDEKDDTLARETTRRVFAETLERTVTRLVDAGKTVLVLGQVPEFPFEPPVCVAMRRSGRDGACATSTAAISARQVFVDRVLERLALRPGVFVSRPTDHLCAKGRCEVEIGGRILYRNKDHLSREGALFLADVMTLPPFVSARNAPITAGAP